MKAVEVLMSSGVPEDRIIFINLVRGGQYALLPERALSQAPPRSRSRHRKASRRSARSTLSHEWLVEVCYDIHNTNSLAWLPRYQITGWIDKGLNEKAYMYVFGYETYKPRADR